MKTRNTPARTVSSEAVRYRSKLRPICVTLYPNGMVGLRLHGARLEVAVDARTIYDVGMKMRVAELRKQTPGSSRQKQR